MGRFNCTSWTYYLRLKKKLVMNLILLQDKPAPLTYGNASWINRKLLYRQCFYRV